MLNKFSTKTLMLTGLVAVAAIVPHHVQAFNNMQALSTQNPLTIQVSDDTRASGAKDFVDSVAQRGIGFLGNEQLSEAQRRAEFRNLLQNSFDMKTIGRFALGRYWKSASDAQKKEYLKLFNKMIVDVYTGRFSEYNGQALKVVSARPEGKADAVVTSKIIPDEGSEIQLDWRVRFKNGKYKVVDIVVEGVSMALTQRSDFSSVIQRGGGNVDVLIEHLRES